MRQVFFSKNKINFFEKFLISRFLLLKMVENTTLAPINSTTTADIDEKEEENDVILEIVIRFLFGCVKMYGEKMVVGFLSLIIFMQIYKHLFYPLVFGLYSKFFLSFFVWFLGIWKLLGIFPGIFKKFFCLKFFFVKKDFALLHYNCCLEIGYRSTLRSLKKELEAGIPKELQNNPKVIKTYLEVRIKI